MSEDLDNQTADDSGPSNYGGSGAGNYEMPYEPSKETADSPLTAREAADLIAPTEAEKGEYTKRTVKDPDDVTKIAKGDVAISAEVAADALTESRRQEAEVEQWGQDAELTANIDAVKSDQPEPPARPEWAPEPQPEYAPATPTELDNLLEALPVERRAPFIEAYNQQLIQAQTQAEAQYNQVISQAQNYAQQFEQGVVQSVMVAEAAAVAPFPELSSAPLDQRKAILDHIGRTNPQRFQEIKAHVAQVKELASQQLQAAERMSAAQQQQAQQQQEHAKQQFRQYADYHDSRVPAVSNLPDVQREILAMAQEHGISPHELGELYRNSPVVRHSAFQAMMLDAARYRIAQKGARSAAYRAVPHVQKPGSRNEEAVRASRESVLERQFRSGKTFTPKEAAEFVMNARAARGGR